MRILITNDDGVGASQLPNLVRWCRQLGDVTVVVPKYEQSGKSHGIELLKPYAVEQVELEPGMTVWTVDSTPADCVRFARIGLGQEYDLCISGINRGLNIGTDMVYSGTVGAALEASALGLKAVALSTTPEYYDHAWEHLDRVFDFVFGKKLLDVCDVFNINIPADPDTVRITRQGGPYYGDDYVEVSPGMYQASGKVVYEDDGDPTLDTNTALHGHISVCPVTIIKTDHRAFEALKGVTE